VRISSSTIYRKIGYLKLQSSEHRNIFPMKIIQSIFLGLVLLFLMSCGQEKKGAGTSNQKADEPLEFPLNIQKGGKFSSLDQIRVQALSIIEHRKKVAPEALSILTFSYWYPEFVFNGQEMSKVDQYAGYWLKFGDDFQYTYGVYSKTLGKGKYHFRLDDNSLFMLDDNVELEPKEWTANNNGKAMGLVGKHTYGVNNSMQVKMLPLEDKPQR